MKLLPVFLCSSLILTSLWSCTPPSSSPKTTQPGTGEVVPVPTVAPTATHFNASLNGSKEVPAVESNATGFASATLNPTKDQLTLQAEVQGLSGEITGAHLHAGKADSTGDVVKALRINGNSLSLEWNKDDAEQALTESLLTQLQAGELYINVHTETHPDGEIRGQIELSTAQNIVVRLSGSEEVPALESEASGIMLLSYDAQAPSLQGQGVSEGLSGEITGAHIHNAAVGNTGDVVKALKISDKQLSFDWQANDSEMPLSETLIQKLEAGELYINVHTEAHPDGEVRGQIRF